MSTDVSTDVSTVFFTSQDGRASLPYGYACWHRLENGAVTFCFAERTSWVTQIFALVAERALRSTFTAHSPVLCDP